MIKFCGSVKAFILSLTVVHVHAPLHELPSTKIYWDFAPAARIALIAAWFKFSTRVWSSELNSLSTKLVYGLY